MKDVYDTIERHFKGARVLLTADCCCSGGLAVEARNRHSRIAYAVLTSTFAHNGSTRAWTYTDSLIRGFGGSPLVDRNNDGHVGLTELADYVEDRMAVVESQKAVFSTFNGFDPHLEIAPLSAPRTDPRLGHFSKPYGTTAIGKCSKSTTPSRANCMCSTSTGHEKWLEPREIRPYQPKEWPKGAVVEARDESAKEKWQPATVLKAFRGLHLVHFNGQTSEVEDQWETPEQIRAK